MTGESVNPPALQLCIWEAHDPIIRETRLQDEELVGVQISKTLRGNWFCSEVLVSGVIINVQNAL